MKFAIFNSEEGFAVILALIMIGMLTLLGILAIATSDDEITIAGNELQEMQAFYAAEAGLEKAAASIQWLDLTPRLKPTLFNPLLRVLWKMPKSL